MPLKFQVKTGFLIFAGVICVQNSFAAILPVDCTETDNDVEKTICGNSRLKKLETEIQQQITAASKVGKVPTEILETTQQQWVETRNQCQQLSCIEDSYNSRLSEIKRYNVTDQQFVRHYIRVLANTSQPSVPLSVMEIHKLDEKRIRVIINSFANSNKTYKIKQISFNAYANQSHRIKAKDLDSKCTVMILQDKDKDVKIRQLSQSCGNSHIKFSGDYHQVF